MSSPVAHVTDCATTAAKPTEVVLQYQNEHSWTRSYVPRPYTMLKDHGIEYEVGDTQRVFDGDIDGIIREYLNHTA